MLSTECYLRNTHLETAFRTVQKSVLFVACASTLVNGGGATEGGIPRSSSPVSRLPGEI